MITFNSRKESWTSIRSILFNALHGSLLKKAHSCTVAEQSSATSFFIFCIKRPWDSVGRFLGCHDPLPKTLAAGLFGSLRMLMGASFRPVSEMPS
jgi:hypothetical protein